MAKLVLSDASVVINSVDLSDHVKGVTLNLGADEVDVSTMSSTAWKEFLAGLKEWSIDLTMSEDYSASSVNATLFPLVGASAVTTTVKPTSSAVGTTNPSFSGSTLVLDYPPVTGTTGQDAAPAVRLRGSGALTRATS